LAWKTRRKTILTYDNKKKSTNAQQGIAKSGAEVLNRTFVHFKCLCAKLKLCTFKTPPSAIPEPFSTKRVAFSSIDDNSDYEKLPHINEVLTKESQKFGNARYFTGIAFVVDWGSFDARILVGRCFVSIAKLTLIGNKSLENLFPTSHKYKNITTPPFLSKQVSIFGNEGQKKISQVKIVLCGAGGIGSIVSEGLLRLGIQKLRNPNAALQSHNQRQALIDSRRLMH
jgi:hypothetical protein